MNRPTSWTLRPLESVIGSIAMGAFRASPTALADLRYPLLETQDEWVLHGLSFPNYLADLGPNAQNDIFGKSSIDLALRDAFRKMRHFLMTTQRRTATMIANSDPTARSVRVAMHSNDRVRQQRNRVAASHQDLFTFTRGIPARFFQRPS